MIEEVLIVDIKADGECGKPHSAKPQYFQVYTPGVRVSFKEESIDLKSPCGTTVNVSAAYYINGDTNTLSRMNIYVNKSNKVAIINNRNGRPVIDVEEIEKNLLEEGVHSFHYGRFNKDDRGLMIVFIDPYSENGGNI